MSPDDSVAVKRSKEKEQFNGTVRLLREGDLLSIKPILETWVRDSKTRELLPEEVEEDLQLMRASLNGGDRSYLVAETTNGRIVGVVGLKTPDGRILPFAKSKNPVELVNLYVSGDCVHVAKNRREIKGVGKALVRGLEDEAHRRGYEEVVLNSGPRYKDSAWGFYDHIYEKAGTAKHYYGDRDARVWRKEL